MAADVTLRLQAQIGNTQQVITALEKKVEKLGNKLDIASKKGRKGAQGLRGDFNKVAKTAGRVALAIGGIAGGIGLAVKGVQLLKREFTDLLARQNKALQSVLTFDQALIQAARNSIGIFTFEEVRQRSIKLAQETGVTKVKAAGAIGAAVTSTGVTNKKEADLAISAARASLRFAPNAATETQESLAAVAASTAKRLDVSTEAAIGFMLRVSTQANVAKLEPQVTNIAPVILNLAAVGFNPTEAGALISTLTQQIGDFSGEISGTAAINLGVGLAKQVRARPKKFPGLEVNEAGKIVDQAGKSAAGRALDILRDDRELKEVFFEGGILDGIRTSKTALGKGKAKTPIRGILTKGTKAQLQFEGSKKAIGGFDEGQGTFDKFVNARKEATPVTEVNRTFKSLAEGLRTADKAGAIASAVREGLEDVLSSSNLGKTSRDIAQLKFEVATDAGRLNPLKAAVGALQDRREKLQKERDSSGPGTKGGFFKVVPRTFAEKIFVGARTPEERETEERRVESFNRPLRGKDEQLQRLDKVIESLEKLNETQQQALKEQKKQQPPKEQNRKVIERNVHR